ncbi:MAG TPA: DUF4065 domain-containing protein [Methanocorpusculum sp.]|nr:DUF4065 domain-containing protein [Methanocorpusculum sp.]
MVTATNVADFFVDLANHMVDENMTNLRVNKMLYYAQAYSLVRFGKPLFSEDIQAWEYGPVVPSVYHTFQKFGRDPIRDVSDNCSLDVFTADEIALLLDVAREYGKYSSSKLIDMTHEIGGPWEQVYHPGELNTVIPKESIKEWFSKNPLPEFEPRYSDDDVIGFHDADGHLVLPREYDDDAE